MANAEGLRPERVDFEDVHHEVAQGPREAVQAIIKSKEEWRKKLSTSVNSS
jgi:hypothetical protein